MGYYVNPPSNAIDRGRELESGTYAELLSQLKDGEVLVGVYDRHIFMNAPHLYSESEFHGFQSQVNDGIIDLIGFYAVPKTLVNA